MVPYIRFNHQYLLLAVCVVLIALFHRFQSRDNTAYYQQPAPQYQERPIRKDVLRSAVSGTIGIDESRGDSVTVSTY